MNNKSKAKSQHYIPQVMLEEWGFNENKNIYFYDNTKKIGEIRTTQSVAYKNFLYSYRLENINSADEKFKKRFIDAYHLNEYKFYDENNEVIENLILLLSDFNNFSKIERNGIVLTKAEMNSLECSIKQWNDTTLEEMLSEIESNWKLVCEKLKLFRNNYLISNNKEKCFREYLMPIWHYIERFVNILYIRNENFRIEMHDKATPLKNIIFDVFGDTILANNMVETYYKNTLNQTLLNEHSFLSSLNINLYLLNDNQNIILPLNYVRINDNTEIDGILLQSAIYIPLTPKILAIVYGQHSNSIRINSNLPDKYVSAINKFLISKSKYFVANFKVDEKIFFMK